MIIDNFLIMTIGTFYGLVEHNYVGDIVIALQGSQHDNNLLI